MLKVFLFSKVMSQTNLKAQFKTLTSPNCDVQSLDIYQPNQLLVRYYMQGEKPSYQMVLATSSILPNFAKKDSKGEAKLLVGYRNILTAKGQSLSWGLVKSKLHCGKAFVFPIEQQQALSIQKFKGEDEIIQTVGTSYILLKIEKDIVRPTFKLTVEALQKLLLELGEVSKINLNIVKNAFDSYEDYRSVIDVEMERSVGIEEGIKQLELSEKVKIEYKSKILSGKGLVQLPLISKDTGKWDEQKIIELKTLEH